MSTVTQIGAEAIDMEVNKGLTAFFAEEEVEVVVIRLSFCRVEGNA